MSFIMTSLAVECINEIDFLKRNNSKKIIKFLMQQYVFSKSSKMNTILNYHN